MFERKLCREHIISYVHKTISSQRFILIGMRCRAVLRGAVRYRNASCSYLTHRIQRESAYSVSMSDNVRVYNLNSSNVLQSVGHIGHCGQLCLHGYQQGNANHGVSSTVHSVNSSRPTNFK